MNPLSFKKITVATGLFICSLLSSDASTNQWQLTTLRSFGNPERNANHPVSGVILGSDGFLYGTTSGGGYGSGAIFRISTAGGGYQQVHNFTNAAFLSFFRPSAFPNLMEASNGRLFGTTTEDAAYYGTIYSVNKDGTDFQIIHEFTGGLDGGDCYGGVIEASDGMLYGTARYGGSNDLGAVFRLNKDGGGYEVVHHFASDEAIVPYAGLMEGSDGALYGVGDAESVYDELLNESFFVSAKVFRLNKDGSEYQSLHDFGGTNDNGPHSSWGLTEGPNGKLYGVTYGYDTNGVNTIFSLGKDGQDFQVLQDLGDREFSGPLHQGNDGRLYGVIQTGGKYRSGSLFAFSGDGSDFGAIKDFGRNTRDTAEPLGALAEDANGTIYGASLGFGWNPSAVFVLRGKKTQLLWTFDASGGDVLVRETSLALSENGMLFGIADRGLNSKSPFVFQISTNGTGLTNVWNAPASKWYPWQLTRDQTNGDLFVTGYMVDRLFHSAIFRVSPNGKKKILHQFGPTWPGGDVLDGEDGFLYGTLPRYGSSNGIVYKIAKNGRNFQTLHGFTAAEGAYPRILLGSDGIIYGTCRHTPESPGSFFRLNRDGSNFAVLRTFDYDITMIGPIGINNDPQMVATNNTPDPHVLFESNNALYGQNAWGEYFKIEKDGSGLSVLTHFYPRTTPILGNDGLVYGMGFGGVFQMNADGTGYTTLHSGINSGTLVQGPGGVIYGITTSGGPADTGFLFRLAPE